MSSTRLLPSRYMQQSPAQGSGVGILERGLARGALAVVIGCAVPLRLKTMPSPFGFHRMSSSCARGATAYSVDHRQRRRHHYARLLVSDPEYERCTHTYFDTLI